MEEIGDAASDKDEAEDCRLTCMCVCVDVYGCVCAWRYSVGEGRGGNEHIWGSKSKCYEPHKHTHTAFFCFVNFINIMMIVIIITD